MKASLLLLPLLACCATAQAQDVPGLPGLLLQPLPIGMVLPTYAGPRIGDIAPQFTLAPLVPRADGKTWSSRDVLGQKAVMLVLIGESPVLTGHGATPASVLSSIVDAASALEAQNVATVVVSRAAGVELAGINPRFDALTLHDESGALNRFYGASPTGITLVGLDRAGFLRVLETADVPANAGAVMRRAGAISPTLAVGQPAPDFAVSDMNGRVRRLSELRNRKNLLLTFFPKCFTGGCANHLTSLQENLAALASADTEVWAVSIDLAEGERGQIAFARFLGLQFPLIPDSGRNLSLLYAAARKPYSTAWRRTMLIDKNGTLRWVDKQINVFTHGPDTLAKMRELHLSP